MISSSIRAVQREGRLADQAYSRIVQIIKSENLDVGDRLPSESQLALTFGRTRTVAGAAPARLAAAGITEARRRAGSFVKRRGSERRSEHMALDDLWTTLGSYELRFVVQIEAARLAAMRRSPE